MNFLSSVVMFGAEPVGSPQKHWSCVELNGGRVDRLRPYTARLKRTLAYSTGLVPPNGKSDKRARAILTISAMLGAINLSRAVSDPNLSREILQQARDQLISLNKPAKAH
jgi:hypothetical protein